MPRTSSARSTTNTPDSPTSRTTKRPALGEMHGDVDALAVRTQGDLRALDAELEEAAVQVEGLQALQVSGQVSLEYCPVVSRKSYHAGGSDSNSSSSSSSV